MKAVRFLEAASLVGLTLTLPATAQAQSGPSLAPATEQCAKNPQIAGCVTPSTPNASDDVIIVTGSRIARPSYDNAQPTITVGSKLLEDRGYTNIAQALNETPGFGVADSSLIGDQGSAFGVGQAFVNLYSLGSQRTLTLVNGRRFVGANPATVFSQAGAGTQVDLNTIPTKLIDRVETVGIGGAPIYGADAIAGTVNIILKRNFSGLDLDAQYGISQQGDLPNYRARALAGLNFGDNRGNVTASFEYAHGDGLVGNQRAVIAAQNLFVQPSDPASPFNLVLASNVRSFLGVPGGNPYFIDRGTIGKTRSMVDANGNFVRFGPNGDLVTFNTGTPTPDPTTFIGGDSLNLADVTNLQVDSTRYLGNIIAHYDVTEDVSLFGEAWYSKNKAINLAGQPVYNTAFFRQAPAGSFDVNGNFIIKVGNPFLTPQAKALIVANLTANGQPADDGADFYVGRANTDLTSGVATLDQDLYRFIGGLEGKLTLFGHDFHWDVSGTYGRTQSISIQPSLVEPNLRRALNVARDINGNIVCAPFAPDQTDPTQPPVPRADPNTPPFETQYNGTISSTCAPLNLFGNGAPSQAARDYVTTLARTTSITSQRDFVANLGGSILTLPGGDVGIALGYENRHEYSSFRPDAFYTTPLGRTIPILPVSGAYTTNEIYGELRVPVISPQQDAFVNALELNIAGRYVHNSATGGAFTWTAGGRFAPIADIAFRGNFTRSIRAPAVTELFAADQPAFDGGYDPCDTSNLSSGPNPATRAANCAAAGLPNDFVSLINSTTQPVVVIGNRNLKNETANSWTVGAVMQPRFARGFSLSVDYIDIKLKNTVVSSSAEDVLSACYDSANYPNNFYCALITRDATPGENFGQVINLIEPYINQGGQTFRAVQVAGDYNVTLPKGFGKLSLNLNYQHLIKQYRNISATSGLTQNRGRIGQSIDRGNLSITYDNGPVSWFNQIQYIGPAVFDPAEQPGSRDIAGVGKYAVYNTSISVRAADRLVFRFNIDNVTNRNLPYPASGSATQNTYYGGLVGRSFLFSVNVKY